MARENIDVGLKPGQEGFSQLSSEKLSEKGVRRSHNIGKRKKGKVTEEEKAFLRKKTEEMYEEGVKTVEEEMAPTFLELKKGDQELEEVLLGDMEEIDEVMEELDGQFTEEERRELSRVEKESVKELSDDVDLEAQFDGVFERARGEIIEAVNEQDPVLLKGEVEKVANVVLDAVFYELESPASPLKDDQTEVSITPEVRIWDVELGKQRINSLKRVTKKGLKKASSFFKSIFSNDLSRQLSSFGDVAKNLGYGVIGGGEKLPQAVAEKIVHSVTDGVDVGFNLFKDFSLETIKTIKTAREQNKLWLDRKKKEKERMKEIELEQSERKEYERLKMQQQRLEFLRTKFGE